jgi:hypothetical protein
VLVAGGVLGLWAVAALAVHGTAAAAQADVSIANLDCAGDPEVVEITNRGTDDQDLSGWQLVSDPAASETFDLTPIGSLPAGGSLFVESGPNATAAATWSTDFIFREGDPTDFARLLDSEGNVVDEAACAAATPAPVSPAATPSPQVVPNGGGPPGVSSASTVLPIAAVSAGGVLLGASLLFMAAPSLPTLLSRMVRRRKVTARAVQEAPAAAEPPREPVRPSLHAPPRTVLVTLAVALTVAVLVALVLTGERSGSR